MTNNENIKLFGSLEIETPDTISTLVDSMTKDQALFLLTESVKFAYKRGVYSLLESEVISRCVRKLYEVETKES
jgi:hypothetical protein